MANKNLFNSIKLTSPKRNHFDLTHDVKLGLNMGDLVPILCMEAVPGDKFNISCESLLRFAPLVSPVMHRMDVTMHYFFVPYRLLWPNWENFITNKSSPEFPYLGLSAANNNTVGSLSDYLGIPLAGSSVITEVINALPFAAYQKIWNEYYRDQNLQTEAYATMTDGDNTGNPDLFVLRKRCWEHDYFTAALPTAQRGTAVSLPLGEITFDNEGAFGGPLPKWRDLIDNAVGDAGNVTQQAASGGYIASSADTGTSQGYDPAGTLVNESTTINDLRRAFRLQEWLEKSMRGGQRYIETILSHFGVKSSDKRLQRPEYITGTKSPVIISEILNTTGTTTQPQGEMTGHGVSVTTGKYGNYFCEEHGFIMGIMSVLPKTAYQDGIPKMFLKTTDPFEYFWPAFANIGEQAVLKKEILAYNTLAYGAETFGYVPRYAEYKYMPSRVCGDFRDSLDFWHLGRKFDSASPPQLNADFVESDPTTRVFAVQTAEEQKLYAHVLNKIKAIRPMPKFGTPTF